MKRVIFLCSSALLASAIPWAYGQTGNAADLQQKLNASFKITTVTANNDIATPGDVVELQKDGLKMSALASLLTDSNTYKDGKIEGGGGKRPARWIIENTVRGFGQAIDPTITAPDSIPPRTLAAGDRCWVLEATVKDDGIHFKLLTDPDDSGMRYHGDLKFPFSKKNMPTTEAALQTIAEVLKVVSSDDQGTQAAQGDQAAQPAQGGQYAAYAGEYLMEQSGQRYVFLSDGSCTMRNPGGTQTPCQFTVDGDWLVVKIPLLGTAITVATFKIQGDKLYMSGIELVRQGGR